MYKILIVEDDPNISSLLQSHIQKNTAMKLLLQRISMILWNRLTQ